MSCQIASRVVGLRDGSFPERPRVAAGGEQVAQLQQRGVGGQRVQRPAAVSRERAVESRPRAPAPPRAAPASTPAYLSRSASSSARVPEQIDPARRVGASSSKSASQIQEMSRPSAIPSLSAIQRSSPPSPSAAPWRQRAEHLVRAGRVLDQQDRQRRAAPISIALGAAERGGERLEPAPDRPRRRSRVDRQQAVAASAL